MYLLFQSIDGVMVATHSSSDIESILGEYNAAIESGVTSLKVGEFREIYDFKNKKTKYNENPL